jgi:steroid delta-isomerase-like uncharacterized protein
MSEENKQLVLRFVEAGDKGDLDAFDEMITVDAVDHNPFPGQAPGLEGVKQIFAMLQSAFPDLRTETHGTVAEGDIVAIVQTITGTHKGEFLGMPPTDKPFAATSVDWVRVRDGMMTEHWGLFDQGSLMMQLGLMPLPEGMSPYISPPRPAMEGSIASPEENKALLRKMVDHLNSGGPMEDFLPMVHPDAVDHTGVPGQPAGSDGWKYRFGFLFGVFSDPAFEILDSVSEGDLISSRYRFRGRQTGEMFGIPATEKPFDVDAIDMIRLRDGKIVEHWGLIDMPAMMAQLGLMPAPEA